MPVTLRDIAKRLNLSHATVSFVLNDRRDVAIPESTRLRVTEAAKEMGYRPNRAARALVSGRTQLVAVWMPSIQEPYYANFLDACSTAARNHGLEVLYHRADAGDSHHRPYDWPVDAVIAIDVLNYLSQGPARETVPVISVGSSVDLRHDVVGVDHAGGVSAALSHLIGNGARRVAYVKRDPVPTIADATFETALAVAGCEGRRIWSDDEDLTVRTLVQYVDEEGLPDGILAETDALAAGIEESLAARGLHAPHHYSLIGMGGPRADMRPNSQLTRLTHSKAELAERTFQLLSRRLAEPNLPVQHEWVTPQLNVSGSTRRTSHLAESA